MENKKKETKTLTTFKGFNLDFKCKGFQYEVGKKYETENKVVRCTANGFHSCKNPLDIFNYYPPAISRFAECQASGDIDEEKKSDTKISSSKILIINEINLQKIIDLGIKFIFDRVKFTKKGTNNKKLGAASNSGYRGAASNSGDMGAASNSGDMGAASNSGDMGAASNSGYRGAASNSGYRGAASNSGDRGAASNSGYRGAASNSGDRGAAFSNGRYSRAETKGEQSVAIAIGYKSIAKASLGNWIVLAERNTKEEIIDIKSFKIDDVSLKSDTFYALKNKIITEIK